MVKEKKEFKGALFYIFRGLQISIIILLLFLVVLVVWTNVFGLPCWAFIGGKINNSVTMDIIERCS